MRVTKKSIMATLSFGGWFIAFWDKEQKTIITKPRAHNQIVLALSQSGFEFVETRKPDGCCTGEIHITGHKSESGEGEE